MLSAKEVYYGGCVTCPPSGPSTRSTRNLWIRRASASRDGSLPRKYGGAPRGGLREACLSAAVAQNGGGPVGPVRLTNLLAVLVAGDRPQRTTE